MSLPAAFLDELRDRVSIAQVVGRKVTWDQRKTNPGKGDYWAPCPFHQEKTASFHVDDKKGFFYCFGCHAKGDALSFVRETENVGFMEAVEILAREAGMQMPAPDPEARARSEARAGLAEVMEAAVQHYRLQLSTAAAGPARAYLEGRGLGEAARERFEIGFAPDSRTALTESLSAKGIAPDDLVTAGLTIKPEDGGAPFDRFRGRIMFPIRDARGRAIAFGGRALLAEARAKYLNSPETPLFDKGRALYNIGPAREAAGKAGALIVAEGYMDVIALAEAGFGHAVAPLGTAITEDQLRLMWRIADEPVIALDGDTAGLRAAMRVIDIALPLLVAGKGLRFCLLPEGLDPDDLIRTRGPAAMQALIDAAQPMVRLLWQRETEGRVFDSPERRAGLDASLRKAIGAIADPSIRDHYRAAIRELRAELFRPARPAQTGRARGPGRGFGPAPPAMPLPGTRRSLLASQQAGADPGARVRETAILMGCINHPEVAEAVEHDLETLPFLCPDLDRIRGRLLQAIASVLHAEGAAPERYREALAQGLETDPVEALNQVGQVRDNPHLAASAPPETALLAVREEIAKQRAMLGVAEEVREAEQALGGVADEGVTWRLQQAGAAREAAHRDPLADDEEGAGEEEEMSRALQSLIDQQIWLKKKH